MTPTASFYAIFHKHLPDRKIGAQLAYWRCYPDLVIHMSCPEVQKPSTGLSLDSQIVSLALRQIALVHTVLAHKALLRFLDSFLIALLQTAPVHFILTSGSELAKLAITSHCDKG
jgi:hypothetical protein